jgi:hypothetical protein
VRLKINKPPNIRKYLLASSSIGHGSVRSFVFDKMEGLSLNHFYRPATRGRWWSAYPPAKFAKWLSERLTPVGGYQDHLCLFR